MANIFVEHDARTIASLLGRDAPLCEGIILKYHDPHVVLGSVLRSNPLSEGWMIDLDLPGSRIVTWSGTLGEDLFEPHPHNWMQPGMDALTSFCDEVGPQLVDHERTICFQPHARHVLSDPQLSLRFLRERGEEPFEIAFAPAMMLETSMVPRIEEHLIRGFEALGPHCAMLTLHDVREPRSEESPLMLAPLGEGILPRSLVLELMENLVPEGTPVVLDAVAIEDQIAWLRA